MRRMVFEGIGLGLTAAVAISGCAKKEPVVPNYNNPGVQSGVVAPNGDRNYSFEAGLYMGCNADDLYPRDPGRYIDDLQEQFAERGVVLDRQQVWTGYYLGVEDPSACE